jgi:hypothetical protein
MRFHDLRLIGIHIKKTAGRSFGVLLKTQYSKKYYRMNIRPKEAQRAQKALQLLTKMPADTRVLHGHFYYEDILPLIEANPDVPVVTWLRDPVQRVMSEYYFEKHKFEMGQSRVAKAIGDLTLLEYVRRKAPIESMTKVLSSVDLADLAFVGIFEYLDEDLAVLASMMGWENYQLPRININADYKAQYPDPSPEEMEHFREILRQDIELYNYALEIRRNRLDGRRK